MNTVEVCKRAGITYRQADYWSRAGLIPGVTNLVDKGSGYPREWTYEQVEFVTVLAQLVRAGINVRVASEAITKRIAEGTALRDLTEVALPGGLRVSLRPRLAAVSA